MSSKKKEIRSNFNKVCLERDKGLCKVCKAPATEVHHIVDRTEMPNGGYVLENGISLCSKCHLDAEQFHISGGKSWTHGLHPVDLYVLIGSSYQKAFKASESL